MTINAVPAYQFHDNDCCGAPTTAPDTTDYAAADAHVARLADDEAALEAARYAARAAEGYRLVGLPEPERTAWLVSFDAHVQAHLRIARGL